jgi:hypothetical protein
MHATTIRLMPLLAAALLLTGCGDDEMTTPTTPTTPTLVTETFNGVVTRNGAQTHTFATQASGTVTAMLKFLVPDNQVKMGFALGTWNGTACQLVITRTDAVEGTVITGAVSAQGTLCVYLHDVGNLVQPAEYEIEVVHP